MVLTMVCLGPFRERFEVFFDTWIGGNLGDMLRGVTYALIAGTPLMIIFYWLERRSKLVEPRCENCSTSFASARHAESVARTNRCPSCDSIVFETTGF